MRLSLSLQRAMSRPQFSFGLEDRGARPDVFVKKLRGLKSDARSNRRNNIVESRLKYSLGWASAEGHARLPAWPSAGLYSTAIAGGMISRRYYGFDVDVSSLIDL